MLYLKNILSQIEDLTGIKDIIGASEEIASMKMRGIRNKVLLSRDMNAELTEIYREVTISYKHQIDQLLQARKSANKSLKRGNGKTAAVYLSANSGFFSKILEKTYSDFAEYITTHEVTPVVIGEFGKKLFMNQFPGRDFIFYTFSEKENDQSSLTEVTNALVDYESVLIFYAKFESMASQTIAKLDVSGTSDSTTAANAEITHYLFEPSLEKILAYFEGEIFAGIIQQTFTESELARYASRISTLDIARENINNKLKVMALQRRFAAHRMMNKKQNEAISGISLWKLAK